MIEHILPPEIGWPVALALMATSFGTSAVTAAFGLGGGVMLLAVLASVLPPAALIPVHGLVQLGSNTGRTLVLRADVARGVLVPFLIGSLVGITAGGLLAVLALKRNRF